MSDLGISSKFTLFILLFLSLNIGSNAQENIWAKSEGGPDSDHGTSITRDNDGNFYITGYFSNYLILGEDTLISNGDQDIFIAKYSTNGKLQWCKRGGGSLGEQALNIAFDGDRNIYVLGGYSGQMVFDNDTLVNGNGTGFLAKITTDGIVKWTKRIGSAFQSIITPGDLKIKDSNSIYLAGSFQNTLVLDTITLACPSNSSCFIAECDSTGHWKNGTSFGASQQDMINSISFDSNNNIYVAGEFSDAVLNLGSISLSLTLATYESFIAKLNILTGNWSWGRVISGGPYTKAGDIVFFNDQQIYVSGLISYTGVFDTISITFNNQFTTNFDFYLARFDSSGHVYWVRTSDHGGAANRFNEITSHSCDENGNSYLSGYVMVGGSFADSSFVTDGAQDSFVAKIDSNGTLSWFRNFGGPLDNSMVTSIDVNEAGQVLILGSFFTQLDFGSIPIYSVGLEDIYIAKLYDNSRYGKFNLVRGLVYIDLNSNCVFDSTEYALRNVLVKADPGPEYAMTDQYGYYEMLLDSGTYTITENVLDTNMWQPTCQFSYNVNLAGVSDTLPGYDFANTANSYCYKLFVDYGGVRRYRDLCWVPPGYPFYLNYGNLGNVPVQNVTIEYQSDPYVYLTRSSVPYGQNGNLYSFIIGTLQPLEFGTIFLSENLYCTYPPGSVRCNNVRINPDTTCFTNDSAYDKRLVQLIGECISNDSIRFVIRNTNVNGTLQTGIFKIFENNFVMAVDTFIIPQGDSLVYIYPATGSAVRFEIYYVDFLTHKFTDGPVVNVEGCGPSPVYGQIGQLPFGIFEENEKTVCFQVGTPHDPNDKNVFPSGISQSNFIKPDQTLQYTLRFQNTGTDTAIKIVIVDTISADLDLSTIRMVGSSDNFIMHIYPGNIIQWVCENALLPDSNVDEPGSNGFVEYEIQPINGLTAGTIIENSAGIIFDYNDPVITNSTLNTIGSLPAASFTTVNMGNNAIQFLNTSTNSSVYFWFFGDGSTDTASSPMHYYTSSGQYDVCLLAVNELGNNVTCQSTNVIDGLDASDIVEPFIVYPNPSQGGFIIDIKVVVNERDYISVRDIAGNEVKKIILGRSKSNYQFDDLAPGVYFINLGPGKLNQLSKKIVKLQ